jgi:hypothetical protein
MGIRESLRKSLNNYFLVESEGDIPSNLKYYAFDWDDNILHMPTKIILMDDQGNDVGMSTDDFALYRHKIGKEDFEYKGDIIVSYSESPFKFFGTSGDKQFIIDSLMAKPGPSWDDFVECLNNGSIFAIITARGHTPSVLKESVYNFIVSNHNGIDSKLLIESLKKFRKFSGESLRNNKNLINDYLDLCKFYPVTYGEGSAADPEEGKVKALREFVSHVKEQSAKLNTKVFFKNDVKNYFVPQIGFSDDDPKNIEHIKSFLEKEYDKDNIVKTYLTKGGEKKEV